MERDKISTRKLLEKAPSPDAKNSYCIVETLGKACVRKKIRASELQRDEFLLICRLDLKREVTLSE